MKVDDNNIIRCKWSLGHQLLRDYHDNEWGKPLYDDRRLLELLILESAEAGLSWLLILKKREGYRNAFCDYDAHKIAAFNDKDFQRLITNKQIVRNKLKIAAAINNAGKFLELQKEFGSFAEYCWGFVDNQQIVNQPQTDSDIAAQSELSKKFSKDLIKRGFKFVGPQIIYSFMQGCGMVNDHQVSCGFK